MGMPARKSPMILIYLLLTCVTSCATLSLAQAATDKPAPPCIMGVQVQSVQTVEKMESGKKVQNAKFQLIILGTNLGDTPGDVSVTLKAKAPAASILPKVDAAKGGELDVSGEAALNTQITAIEVKVKDATVSSDGFQINIIPTPPAPKVSTFQIKFDHSVDKTFTNLHTMVVTKTGGDGSFDSHRNHMHVELAPPGATDLQIVDVNEQQMELHFIALPDYQPSQVLVTVYNGSDLDTRQAVAVAQPAPSTPAADPNQPKISRVDVVFLNRSQGNGRVRIYGSGFGKGYKPAPYPVDDYLYYCLQREDINSSDRRPQRRAFRRSGCERLTNPKFVATTLQSRDGNIFGNDFQNPESKWRGWRENVRGKITVTLNSRNTDLRIERVEIIDVNDSYIDVYFEFTRYPQYSMPFRLGGVTVLVQKINEQTTSSKADDGVTVNVVNSAPKTYQAYQDVGKAPNPDLTYRYTVLDKNYVNKLLGRGIADNFYVLQVAMVNSGTKKVSVPLAAIQAEVEWARGSKEPRNRGNQNTNSSSNQQTPATTADPTTGSRSGATDPATYSDSGGETGEPDTEEEVHTSYLEGPPTVSPARLAAVSAHFDAYQKTVGLRARIFNILDGLTTFGAALVPFAGPSLQDAHTVVTGGFIPGLHKAVGDLSSQQLQNLTALSWQDTESIASGGGSIEKLIYIQRYAQFSSETVKFYGTPKKVEKQITNLLDLDITGYEVNESTGAQATSTSSSQSKPVGNASPAGAQ